MSISPNIVAPTIPKIPMVSANFVRSKGGIPSRLSHTDAVSTVPKVPTAVAYSSDGKASLYSINVRLVGVGFRATVLKIYLQELQEPFATSLSQSRFLRGDSAEGTYGARPAPKGGAVPKVPTAGTYGTEVERIDSMSLRKTFLLLNFMKAYFTYIYSIIHSIFFPPNERRSRAKSFLQKVMKELEEQDLREEQESVYLEELRKEYNYLRQSKIKATLRRRPLLGAINGVKNHKKRGRPVKRLKHR